MSGRHDPMRSMHYVLRALNAQILRDKVEGRQPPVDVLQMLEDIGFRVSRGQDGSRDAGPAEVGHGGSGDRLMVRFETAARMLEMSLSTVKRLVREGSLPAVHVGGAARIRVADLESFVDRLGQPSEHDQDMQDRSA